MCAGTGRTAENEVANKARFTITMNIEDVVKFAKGSLKHNGFFFHLPYILINKCYFIMHIA